MSTVIEEKIALLQLCLEKQGKVVCGMMKSFLSQKIASGKHGSINKIDSNKMVEIKIFSQSISPSRNY